MIASSAAPASPTMGTSTRTFLLSGDGSMSMGIVWELRAVTLVADGVRPAIGARREQDVLGQVDHDRTRPAGARDIERLMQDARQVVDVLDQVVVLGAWPGDAGGVGFLEGVVADQVGR